MKRMDKRNIVRKIYKIFFIIINYKISYFTNNLNFNNNIIFDNNKIDLNNKSVVIDDKIDLTQKYIEINNKKKVSYYEDNIDFSDYSTNI